MRAGNIEGLFPSLTHRDFRLLWIWGFVSNIGTWVQNVALGLYIHEVYHAPGWLGLVNFFTYLPVILFFLPAGSLADSRDRRRILIATQMIMIASALALAVLVQLGIARLPGICLTAFLMGVGVAFNFPAWLAIVPELVPREHLLNAISLNAASWNLARFLGPMLASAIIAVASFSACFFVNGASFFPFVIALLAISLPAITAARGAAVSRRTIAAGISYAYRRRLIRNLLITLGTINLFALPYIVFIPVFGKDILKRGNLVVSALYAAAGLGAVVGAPLVTRLNRTVDEITLVRGGVAGIALSLLAFSWSTTPWLSIPLAFTTGLSFLTATTSINTTLQLKTEPEMRGRVMSFYVFMLAGAYPVGGALLGLIANWAGMSWAMTIGASLCLAWGAMIILRPELLGDAR